MRTALLLNSWLVAVLFTLGAGAGPAMIFAAEVPDAVPAKVADTNSQDILRAFLGLQEQIHATQLAVERSRQDAQAAAQRNADDMATRIQLLEQTLNTQRTGEFAAMQRTNHLALLVAGTIAAVGLLAMLLTAYFQWRAANRLAEVYSIHPSLFTLASSRRLMAGDGLTVPGETAAQSNARLLGVVESLQQRIRELEQTAHAPLNEPASPSAAPPPDEAPAGHDSPGAANGHDLVSLLAQGQSLLGDGEPEKALVCFDEILALEPRHAEALVKRGTALEKLRRLDEAIECYDRAIEADRSMTLAYLYKGGLFNRLEKYNEALECYELALRAQEKDAD